MCSRNCPCKTLEKKEGVSSWQDMTREELDADYKRSKVFVFTSNPDVVTYDSYDDCIENIKDPSVPENLAAGYMATQAFYRFATSFRNQADFTDIKEWIEFFEDEYECAGICKKALFNWIQPVSEGIPTKSCVSAVKDDLTGSFMGLAICTLISGVLLFFIWLCQYCLWRNY